MRWITMNMGAPPPPNLLLSEGLVLGRPPYVFEYPHSRSSLPARMHILPFPRVILPVLMLALITLVPVSASAQTQGDVDNAKTAEEQAFQALLDADKVLEANLGEMENIQG